ncbi:MAG: tetraacyldisaccharide 4'-kinase [Armatimonadetes bacterium]|nr:tetraacyldisaccharide 4'-kinase [Armatimonadota bacterium]
MSTDWSSVWLNPNPPVLLRILAALYRFGWRAYQLWYRLGFKRPVRVGAPVICVGSLLVGGSGKTPATIAIAELLHVRFPDLSIAILTGGYGGSKRHETTVINPGESALAEEVGDETAMIRQRLPWALIVVGRRRVAAARVAVDVGARLIIMDDGFQHLPLYRDINLCAMPARLPNNYCLPAGPLREPLDGLTRATRVVKMDDDAIKVPGSPIRLDDGRTPLPEGAPVIALSAIAQPEAFEGFVRSLNVDYQGSKRFGDHHTYLRPDIEPLMQKAFLVTTEKDATKLAFLTPEEQGRAFVVPLQLRFSSEFEQWLVDQVLGISRRDG